ncbi:MAG TPA: nitrate ABC transporter ATP-binding protein [Polyangiales bacterium]|nr:nitrate ABC transporter ATP-binding protein [Polyangiales bacterium]
MAYVELRDVSKEFETRDGKRFVALERVNLQIERGEFVSVIGHSGCGKSTVLNLLAGLLPVTRGTITVGGEQVRGPGPDRMVAFQNHSLLPWLTIRQNIELAVDQVHRDKSAAERRELVDSHLLMVHLMPAADRYPNQVSGGMKQRCGIARAFVTKPKVLLLDEPFGALDAMTRANLQDELVTLWERERVTVMMITHEVDEALLLSDRIVMMANGPAAHVADVMRVELPRPRARLTMVDHPSFYRQRGELLYYLNKCKRAKQRPAASKPVVSAKGGTPITVGFVPLLDCAPFAVAQAEGLFAKHGLNVSLSREPSWKVVSDGVREGRLAASQMVAGLPIAETLGIGREPFAVTSAITTSRGGNAITFGNGLRKARVTDRETLKRYLFRRKSQSVPPLIFGVTHPASMHNLVLRAWLADGGIDPDLDLKLAVVPPPQMVANLQAESIAGYCVGEPWNTRAVRAELGTICATDAEVFPSHTEKVLGASAAWAKGNPKEHLALVRALLEAGVMCDDEEYRKTRLPELMARPEYVGGSVEDFKAALGGPFDYGAGRVETLSDLLVFSKAGANLSRTNEMLWILAQMARWGMVAFPEQAEALVSRVYDETVLRAAAAESGIEIGEQDRSIIRMSAQSQPFDPSDPFEYLNSLEIRRDIAIDVTRHSEPVPSSPTQSGKVVAA